VALPLRDVTHAKLERLTRAFGGQAEVGRLLRVDRSRISRWLRGEDPGPENGARLDALEYVYGRLLRAYHPRTALKWLSGFNAHLGNRRPIDVLLQGQVADVIAAIEQDELNSYA
jgi:transcriptional regulator with XRE-family HTH domain